MHIYLKTHPLNWILQPELVLDLEGIQSNAVVAGKLVIGLIADLADEVEKVVCFTEKIPRCLETPIKLVFLSPSSW